MTEKKTYKLSATIINTWKYYLENPSKRSFDSIVSAVRGEFKHNKWTRRGMKYEDEVYEGKHGKVSQLVEHMAKQEWCSDTIDKGEFFVRLSGKTDAIDKQKKIIIDIKRVDTFAKEKYDYSFQHTLYFYLNPEMQNFYYVVVEGKDNEITGEHVISKRRPSREELEKEVHAHIDGFIEFLKENNLWEEFKANQEYKGR